ncbi:MAG: LytR/AlgR family response regulator transcription factor [Roseburia sp.]
MRIAICDDEAVFREQLKTKLENYYKSLDVWIQSYASGEDFTYDLEKIQYDLVFLDIEMGGMDGFETAKRLKAQYPESTIIFLTSHTDLAMEGYEVQAFRFLAKPIVEEKLFAALQAFEERLHKVKKIAIMENGTQKYIRCMEIRYIKSENVYLKVVTEREIYWVRKKLKEILEELPSEMFVMVHRSYIINLEYVKCFNGTEIILEDETEIPVSKGKRDFFKQQMMRYMKEKK